MRVYNGKYNGIVVITAISYNRWYCDHLYENSMIVPRSQLFQLQKQFLSALLQVENFPSGEQ